MQNSKKFLLVLLFSIVCCKPLSQKDKVLRIGIIDSFFCPISGVDNAISAVEGGSALGTSDECRNYKTFSKKLHGHLVLLEILKTLKDVKPVLIPVNIFNDKGRQSLSSWSKAIEILKEKRVQLIVSASGAFNNDLSKLLDAKPLKGDITFLLSAGNILYPINKDTYLWPQHYIDDDKGLLIGHYIEPKYKPKDGKVYGYLDFSLKYQESIKYLMGDDKNSQLKMSSLAVAKFSGYVINFCHQEILARSTRSILKCIQQNSKALTILNSKDKQSFRTF